MALQRRSGVAEQNRIITLVTQRHLVIHLWEQNNYTCPSSPVSILLCTCVCSFVWDVQACSLKAASTELHWTFLGKLRPDKCRLRERWKPTIERSKRRNSPDTSEGFSQSHNNFNPRPAQSSSTRSTPRVSTVILLFCSVQVTSIADSPYFSCIRVTNGIKNS